MLIGMSLFKDEAVVLRRIDHSETSQVLVFFGREHGQVHLIAKGIKKGTKKAFAAGLDLLEAGTVGYSRREARSGLGTLTEWRQMNAYLGLRRNIRSLYAGQYAAEITSQLTEQGDPHPELYDGLIRLLVSLDANEDVLPGVVAFQRQLLESTGLLPIFDGCAACQRSSQGLQYFSAGQGGMICRDCEPAIIEKRRVEPAVASALAQGSIPASGPAEAFDLLNYAITYAMGKASRLAPYINGS